MENFYAYIIAILLLTAFLIFKELKRVNRARLIFRMLAVVLAAVSLLFFIIPIKYQSQRKTDLKSLHFLTPGVTAAELKDETYLTSDSAVLKQLGNHGVKYVPDLIYHLRANPAVSNLIVYGYGLPSSLLKKINIAMDIRPSVSPEGIISCSWPDVQSSTETFRVQGIYNNTRKQAVKLVLNGLGTKLDSITIAAGQQLAFNLECKPKQIGKAVYALTAKRGNEIIEEEEVPFQVVERPKIKVLVLASFPDFEYKFLRNWLFENKYQAYFRTRVSKDKFSVEQVNLETKASDGITGSTFKNYDLVIADDEELGHLGAAGEGLTREIAAGLGLIVRINEAKALSAFTRKFQLFASTDSITTLYQPVIVDVGQKLKKLTVNQPVYIGRNGAQLPLVEDQQGKILSSLAMVSKGRVTATTIPATFNWVLGAANADYTNYWTAIMNRTARKTNSDFQFLYSPRFPVQGELVSINFQASPETELPQFSLAGKLVPVQQHQWLPFYWQANFWSKTTGWNPLEVRPGTKQALYIYKKTAWLPLKMHQLLKENQIYGKQLKILMQNKEESIEVAEKQVSDWVFLAVFLFSMGFLWYETKILQ
jgi:hypothetical protein